MPKLVKFSLILLLALSAGGCARALPEFTQEGFAMDSYYRVTAGIARNRQGTEAQWITSELGRLEQRYDLFDSESFLSRYNREEVQADQEMEELLNTAGQFAKISAGAYQVAIAPLTRLWSEAIIQKVPPRKEQVEAALATIKANPRVIDFGSLLKGYAADQIYHRLNEVKADRALIDMGGTVRVLGSPSWKRHYWRVALRNPAGPGTLGYFELRPGQAVATSGDYERGFDYQGERFHHLIDPATGYPATDYRSVSVVAGDAVSADILSTLFFVAGPQWVESIQEATPFRALFIDKKGKIELYGNLDVKWVKK